MSWTVNDLEPPFEGAVTQAGVGVDLSAATAVEVHIRRSDESVLTRAVVPDGDQSTNPGQFSMAWEDGDLSIAGWYDCEVQVTWPGARPQTFGISRFKVNSEIA